MNDWITKKCMTCGAEFRGRHFMKQCKSCYWYDKGFAWRCPKRKALHTPDDLKMLWYGGVVGSGMWGEKELLMKIESRGGFEQYSHENWDEVWKVELYASRYGLQPSVHHHDPPVETSGSCLICAIKDAVAEAKKRETIETSKINSSPLLQP